MNNMTMSELYAEKEYYYAMLMVAENDWKRTEYILEQIEKLSREMASRKEKVNG